MAALGQIGRQPAEDGVVAAERGRGEQAGRRRHPEQRPFEDLAGTDPDVGLFLQASRLPKDFGFLQMTAEEQDSDGRQQAEPEHGPPGDVLRQDGEDDGEQEGGGAIAHRPAALHGADGAAAIFLADHLAHQGGARGPFASEAEALEAARDHQLAEGMGETRKRREDREPEDGDLQDFLAADPVGQEAGDDAAER